MKKKQWQKPQLVVLVRSKPEEAVLSACKSLSDPGVVGPMPHDNSCMAIKVMCNRVCFGSSQT